MTNEVWRDIEGFEGLYQVSNLGNIKNVSTGNIKKQTIGNTGYSYVYLYKNNIKKTFTVHRLVAKSFITNQNKLSQVNHKDGNKQNNNVDNLEWSTPRYNILHSIYTLDNKPVCNTRGMFGINNKRSKKIGQYDKSGNLIKIYYGGNEIKRELNLSTCSHILEVVRGTRKTAFGYCWKEMG